MKVGKFNFIVYVIVFAFLLLSSFFRLYNDAIFKLLIPVVIGLLGVNYYLKNDLLGYFKLGILVLFLGHHANQYFYIVLTLALFNFKILLPARGLINYIYLLFILGFVSYIFNQFIEWNILSYPFFFASFFFAVAIFFVSYKYSTHNLKKELMDFYVGLVLILAIVALIQNKTTGATVDYLTGGTTSSHTLGFHMAVGFLYTFTKLLRGARKQLRFVEILLLLLTIPVMYLADAKYLLLNSAISVSVIFLFFHMKKVLRPIILLILLVLSYQLIDTLKTTTINISPKVSFTYMDIIEKLTLSAKFQLVEETLGLYKNEPLIFALGSGPGTFLSRASNSRSYDTMEKKADTGAGSSVVVKSKLPSFIPSHTTWVTHKYATKYFNKVWFGTLFDYRSSLLSFFWEFGIIGFSVFMLFFITLIMRVSKWQKKLEYPKTDAFFIQSFVVFYLLNSMLAYYFEYPETLILFWLFIGMFNNKNHLKGAEI